MSEKYANLSMYSILAIIAVCYFVTAQSFDGAGANTIGPGYFPKLLGIGLFLFSVIGIVATIKEKNAGKIVVENIKMIVVALIAVIAFLLIWKWIDAFYVITFIFLIGLTAIFRKDFGATKKNIAVIAGSAIGMTMTIYLIFDKLMGLSM
jgi:hypothetical protein